MKLAQVLKLYNRLRYVNIFFGPVLGLYRSKMGDMFNDEDLSPDNVYRMTAKHSGKLSTYNTQIFLPQIFSWKLIAYPVSWILRMIEDYMIKKMRKEGSVTKGKCKAIRVFQKIHFLVFNMIIIDVTFFSVRALLHTTDYSIKGVGNILLSMLLLAMITADLLEIY